VGDSAGFTRPDWAVTMIAERRRMSRKGFIKIEVLVPLMRIRAKSYLDEDKFY
jgi:hypothetical protein